MSCQLLFVSHFGIDGMCMLPGAIYAYFMSWASGDVFPAQDRYLVVEQKKSCPLSIVHGRSVHYDFPRLSATEQNYDHY